MLSLRSNHRPSLFWRTFILLCGLIFFSVVGWLQSFRVLSELPYSQGVAQHIVSTANLTKYALVTADPLFRVDLLKLLAARDDNRNGTARNDLFKALFTVVCLDEVRAVFGANARSQTEIARIADEVLADRRNAERRDTVT